MIDTIQPRWSAPGSVSACCTTRVGGVSQVPYDSLNFGLHVGDDADSVAQNRARLVAQLLLPTEPDWIRQVHGTRAVTLESDQVREADAAITRQVGRVAVVMVADCLPILVCNRDGSEVAAIHAGWRGLQAGVVQSTLSAMQTPASELMAWIGPGISQPHFEVGDEVLRAFEQAVAGATDFFIGNRPGHWLCDLGGLAEQVLKSQGVGQVSRDSHCTYRDAERLFSYRRDGDTGRMAALIWIS